MAPRQGCCLASVGTQGPGPLLWPNAAGGSTPASSCCRHSARPACSSASIFPGEPPCLTRREVQRTHNLLGAWRTCQVPGSVAFSRRKDGPGRSILSQRGEEQALEPQGRQVTGEQRHLRAEPALTNHLLHSPHWAQAPKLPQAAPYKATSSPR